jgi:hypothetical protein
MVNGANMWHVDASGNAAAAGTVSGAALAGGILSADYTWTGNWSINAYGPAVNNTYGADVAFGTWNYNSTIANGSSSNLGGLQFRYNNSTTDTGMLGMRGNTDSTGALTDFQVWFYSYKLNASAMTIDYFTGDVNVYGTVSGKTVQSTNWSSNPPATSTLTTAYSTTSTTLVSTGFGISTTTNSSSTIIDLRYFLTTGGDTAIGLFRSTSGIPAAGTAPPSGDVNIFANANHGEVYMDLGLTSGVTYYYYVAIYTTVSGNTATLEANSSTTPTYLTAKSI